MSVTVPIPPAGTWIHSKAAVKESLSSASGNTAENFGVRVPTVRTPDAGHSTSATCNPFGVPGLESKSAYSFASFGLNFFRRFCVDSPDPSEERAVNPTVTVFHQSVAAVCT